MSSQYCKPEGSDPVWRCPVCGQWWQLDLPDGDFWEPMSTLKAFLFYHVKWKAERKHRKAGIRIMCDQTDGTTIKLGAIETDKTGGTIYSARRYLTQDMYWDTVTLALLRWIAHLEQFSQTNQTKEDA